MEVNNNIVLIGLPSSGKSTIGKELAQQLNKTFIDLDLYVEEIYEEIHGIKLSYREIFKSFGRDFFRDLETQALIKLSNESNIILSTGGGTPLKKDNRSLLRAIGVVTLLYVKPSILVSRLQERGYGFVLEHENPLEYYNQLWKERALIYNETAHIEIDSSDITLSQTIDIILSDINMITLPKSKELR